MTVGECLATSQRSPYVAEDLRYELFDSSLVPPEAPPGMRRVRLDFDLPSRKSLLTSDGWTTVEWTRKTRAHAERFRYKFL